MAANELQEAIDRIESLLRLLVKLQAGPILDREMDDEFKRGLYELTGGATSREIQRKLKVGPNRISETWNRWERLGLVIKDGNTYEKAV